MTDVVDHIRQANSFRQLGEEIRRVEFSNLETLEIAVAAHKLAEISHPAPSVRIALLGTHTFEPLPNYLKVRAAASQKTIECWSAPYGQYMQPVSPPARELRELNADIVLLSAQMRSIAPRVVEDFGSFSEIDAERERRRILDHVLAWADQAAEVTTAKLLVANFPRPRYLTYGVADAEQNPSERSFYTRLDMELYDAMRSRSRCGVLDLESVVAAHGAEIAWTRRGYYLAKQPWQPGLCMEIARDIWRHVIAIKGWSRKCLVLDLDNTLWGGIVGEDGPQGIRVGPGDPEGEAYADFQRVIRSLKGRGVLLAIASKNNPEDVAAAFRERPDMPLRADDFSAMEIGWGSKSNALDAIAQKLNIAVESLVFLDDNPAERMQVRGALPQVVIPEMPDDPGLYASFLKRQAWFEQSSVTAEDVGKTRQYQNQAERAARKRAVQSLEQYLEELGTRIEIRRAQTRDVPRVQQLFTKTNQFNVTSIRYSVGEVQQMLASSQQALFVARAQDCFGDLGQIGLFLLDADDAGFRIDSFLLSCRALGRGIETALMNALKTFVQDSGSQGSLHARYVPTGRNSPAAGFFESQGLTPESTSDEGVIQFSTPIAELRQVAAPHILVEYPRPPPTTR